jgi:intein-encoded DNA endonuclease-like protein
LSEQYGPIDYARIKQALAEKLTPDYDLGYALGVLVGDGCLYYAESCCAYSIILMTTNKELLNRFQTAMQRVIGKKPGYVREYDREPSGYRKRKGHFYRVVFYSKEWYENLKEMVKLIREGFIPFEDHEEFAKGFVKGFYDAEGYAGRYNRAKQNKKWVAWQLCIRNTNVKLLQAVNRLLRKYAINPTNIYLHEKETETRKAVYSLAFSRKNEIQKLSNFIGGLTK